MKKYKATRISERAYKNFLIKQERMSKMFSKITGKNKKIPMIKVINIASENPIYLDDYELVKHFGKRKI